MKAVVLHDVGDMSLDDVDEPKIQEPTDAIALDPTEILTQQEPMTGAIDAYEVFDRREPGWIKVELEPAAAG